MLSFPMAVSRGETRFFVLTLCWRGLACASLLFCAVLGAAAAETETRFFRIGTAATGGSFFEIGGVVASAISSPVEGTACGPAGGCGVPGLVAVAQATQGSMENLRLINSGQIESGFVQANLAAMAYAGIGAFANEGAMPQLRVIASLFPEALHVVVRMDSPIRSLDELAGKTVATGELGSGTAVNSASLLAAAGFGENDVIRKNLRPAQAADEMKAGTVDALIVAGGQPIPAIQQLAAAVPIRLLPITGPVAAKLQSEFSSYERVAIPAGAYRNVDTDTPSVGFHALWMVAATADLDLVYGVTRSLWSEGAEKLFAGLDPIGKRISLGDALAGVSVPLHPGAERYYRERGLQLGGLPVVEEARKGAVQ
jgi:TRAP transporter TAXI family solute receptor